MMSGLIKFKQGDEEENVIAGCLDECPGEKQTLITRWFCIVPKDRYPLKIPNRNNPPHETPTPPYPHSLLIRLPEQYIVMPIYNT